MLTLFLIFGAVWLLVTDMILTADLLRSEARLRRDLARRSSRLGQNRVPTRSETWSYRILRWSTGAMLLFAVVLALTLS